MKYTFKKIPDSQVELEVVLDHQEFLDYWQPVYDHELEHVHLKGFRPGAAPKEMADRAVDKGKVFEQAVSKAVRDQLQEITKDKDWQLIDQPKIEVLESQTGLKFKVLLTVFPEIKLGNYQKIARDILKSEKPAAITDLEVERSIKWVLNSRAKITRVSREAKNGDLAEIDFQGFINGQNQDRLNGKAERFTLGEGKFIPGFEDKIVGHKEGEDLEFSVIFPKDYWEKTLQNQSADFKVRINGVFDREAPELNDDFVKGLGNFASVADFQKSVRQGLEQEKKQKEQERIRLKILEAIGKHSSMELPKIMVAKTLNNLVSEYEAMSGKKGLSEGKELHRQLEENAQTSVRNNLVLYQITKEEHLEPTPEEVEAESNKFLAHSNFSKQPKIDPQRLYDYIYGILQNRKVFEFLENLK